MFCDSLKNVSGMAAAAQSKMAFADVLTSGLTAIRVRALTAPTIVRTTRATDAVRDIMCIVS